MPVLSVLPTCLFRGINVSKLVEDYNEGKFSDILMPENIIKVDTNVYDLYGDSPYDQIYSVTDGNQLQRVTVTTNHMNFSEKINELKQCNNEGTSFLEKQLDNKDKDNDTAIDTVTSQNCKFCGQHFNHKPVGIPFKVEETTVLHKNIYKNVTVFHCCAKFHDFPCALGYIERKIAAKYDQRDSRYIRAKYNLIWMYNLMHPKGPFLEAAVDSDVLDINDGCVTVSDYNKNKYQYVNTGNIIVLPCKEEFSRNINIKIKT